MQYTANTSGAQALVAATAKTILNIVAPSTSSGQLIEFGVFFDGVTGSNTPVLVELMKSTQAGAGTSTEVTPTQSRGDGNTTGAGLAPLFKAFSTYTAGNEPTALLQLKQFLVPPTSGILYQLPLGREVAIIPSMGLALRVTAPQVVNVRAYMEFIQGPS